VSQCRNISDTSIQSYIYGEEDPEEFRGEVTIGLTRLDASFCSLLSDDALAMISLLPALTSLDCSWLPEVTDDGVQAMLQQCSSLNDLSVGGCCKVSKEKREAIAQIKGESFQLRSIALPNVM